ncbi:MAG: WbqC family protein, partial [Pseudomonadota bacterium]
MAVAAQLNQSAPLCETLVESSERLAKACGASLTDTMLSTEISAQSKGTERVLHLVKEVGGTRYVTGHGARNYLDHAAFE